MSRGIEHLYYFNAMDPSGENNHAYGIYTRLGDSDPDFLDGRLTPTGVLRVLRGLESRGFVTSEPANDDADPRRTSYYSVTAEGAEYAKMQLEQIEATVRKAEKLGLLDE